MIINTTLTRPTIHQRPSPTRRPARTLAVFARSQSSQRGIIVAGSLHIPCALGRSGQRVLKREGDGATPRGIWPVMHALYRRDRIHRMPTRVPLTTIKPHAGWCDAPDDRNYNRPVPRPYPASSEALMREDHLYDVIVVLDYNFSRRSRNRGSAIFLHIASPGFRATEGCIAVTPRHMRHLLKLMRPGDRIAISARSRPRPAP